jgi:hypothetical protein
VGAYLFMNANKPGYSPAYVGDQLYALASERQICGIGPSALVSRWRWAIRGDVTLLIHGHWRSEAYH